MGYLGAFTIGLSLIGAMISGCFPLSGGKRWHLSVLASFVALVSFVGILLFQRFWGGGEMALSVWSGAEIRALGGGISMRWDGLSVMLSVVISVIFFSYHFLSGDKRSYGWSEGASILLLLTSYLGVVASSTLFSFLLFWAVGLVPRILLCGFVGRERKMGMLKDSVTLSLLGFLFLCLLMLMFAPETRQSLDSWLLFEGAGWEISPDSIGFWLLVFLSAILSGTFPFHGELRRVYSLNSIEDLAPLALQPVFGFTLLIRFLDIFPAETIRYFGPIIFVVGTILTFLFSLRYWVAKEEKERIYWIQQIILNICMVGIFTLSASGWRGAFLCFLFQALSVPLLIFVFALSKAYEIGNPIKTPKFSLVRAIALMIVLFLPVSFGFQGLLIIFSALRDAAPYLAIPLFGAVLLFSLVGARDFLGVEMDVSRTSRGGDLTKFEILAVAPILFLLITGALIPALLNLPMGDIAQTLIRKVMGV